MGLNTNPFLIISTISLILSFPTTAQEYSPPAPSPGPVTVSFISSSPDASPSQAPALAPGPSSSSSDSPAPAPGPYSSYSDSPAPSPTPVSFISASPDASPANAPSPSNNHIAFVLGSYIRKGVSSVEEALDILSSRVNGTDVSHSLAECLDQCIDNYNAILEDFKRAQDDADVGDFSMIRDELGTISGDIDVCQDCMKKSTKNGESIIAKLEESTRAAAVAAIELFHSNY